MKKIVFAGLIIVLLAFLVIGYGLFTNSTEETGNGGDQSLGESMAKMEENADIDEKQILFKVKEGSLDKSEVKDKVEQSLKYLEDNLNNLSIENDQYLHLLYHSTFLLEFSDAPMSKMTETEKLISKHRISVLAEQAHTYIVDQEQNDSLSTKITEDIAGIKILSINEFVELIMAKAKEQS